MAKARSRSAARKVKDRWRSKNWYNIRAPASFDNVTVAETLTDDPNKLIDRVTEVSLQDLTNDFRKSHIKLYFKVNNVEDNNAQTHFVGHTLTSDYLRRLIRRRRSKIDSFVDVDTRDGATVRVKPFATTDKRIQSSQKHLIREKMNETISKLAKSSTLSEFVTKVVDGTLGRDIYKDCKKLYPVKRVEIFKTELISRPTIKIEDKPKKEDTETEEDTKETTEEDKETKKDEENESEKTEEDKPKKEDTETEEDKDKKEQNSEEKDMDTKEKPEKEETKKSDKESDESETSEEPEDTEEKKE